MASAMLCAYWPARAFSSASTRASSALQLFAGAGQNLGLDVEFLAGDQVELGKNAAHRGLGIFFDVLGRRVGQQGAHFGAEIFKNFGSSMGVPP
jgi:hypothetical protein